MRRFTTELTFPTERPRELVDITALVREAVSERRRLATPRRQRRLGSLPRRRSGLRE